LVAPTPTSSDQLHGMFYLLLVGITLLALRPNAVGAENNFCLLRIREAGEGLVDLFDESPQIQIRCDRSSLHNGPEPHREVALPFVQAAAVVVAEYWG